MRPRYMFIVDGKIATPEGVTFPFINGELTPWQRGKAIKEYAEHHAVSPYGIRMDIISYE